MSRGRTLAAAALAAGAVLLAPAAASACAVCFGDPEAPMTQGLNRAILVLVGFVGLVYVGIVKVIWDIRKRSRRLADRTELRLLRGGKH